MKHAIVSFGYSAKFLVPVKDLSKFLELITSCPQVEYGYLETGAKHYLIEGRSPSIEMLDADRLITEAEYYALRNAEKAAAEAAKQATEVPEVEHE
jgi:hypothetical protein